MRARVADRDPLVNDRVAPAQIAALTKWGAPKESSFEYLRAIKQPTLVDQGPPPEPHHDPALKPHTAPHTSEGADGSKTNPY